jgi:hypothetical protein
MWLELLLGLGGALLGAAGVKTPSILGALKRLLGGAAPAVTGTVAGLDPDILEAARLAQAERDAEHARLKSEGQRAGLVPLFERLLEKLRNR